MKKILICLFIFIVLYFILYSINYNYTVNNDIPIIKIELKGTDLETINNGSKDNKYFNNTIRVYDNNKRVFKSKVGIKGRGNYTWGLDKKPYQIIFDEKTSFLDLPKSKKFVLLANDVDSSLLRNDFSYSVAKRMNLNYSFTGKYIDLYVDGKYIGNYYITPKIDINSATVDIDDDNAILMELDDNYYMYEKKDEVFESELFHDHLVLKDSNSDDKENIKIFMDKYNKMEEAINVQDFDSLKEIIDIESFAKYYIISEFASSFDAVRSSLFFYMDGYDDKIHIGPLWDFDVTYGIKEEYNDTSKFIIRDDLINYDKKSVLFYKLLQDEEFSDYVKNIWKEIGRDTYLEEIKLLDNKVSYLEKSANYNNNHWNRLDYGVSVDRFIKWLNERYEYFNDYMEG